MHVINAHPKPSLKEAFFFWLKLGFISFGGPAGQIAIMHDFIVEKKKWVSEKKFLHALNFCMLLPGPEAQQLATYIGWLLHGTRGGIIAGVLFFLPSMLILLLLSIVYVKFGKILWVTAFFDGLKPAVIAIVLVALVKIGKKSIKSILHLAVAVSAFVGIFYFNIPFPLIILTVILSALIIQKYFPLLLTKQENLHFIHEENIYINPYSWVKKLSVGILLWLMPLVFFLFVIHTPTFWYQLSMFFTKAAFVTFGGAYAVLPYVAQVSVEKFGWLSFSEMIDGLALGETTPGPLVMVLAFVGFMAGYHFFGGSILMGSLGLMTTTYYTFLPCFLFVLIGAPYIEKTIHNQKINATLSMITAAIVGVILNLAVYLGKVVIFTENIQLENIQVFSVFWIIISIIALYRFKINTFFWIMLSGVAGVLYFFI
jgi:chromate transporter